MKHHEQYFPRSLAEADGNRYGARFAREKKSNKPMIVLYCFMVVLYIVLCLMFWR